MLWRNWYDCKNLALLKPSQPQLEKQYLSLAFSDIRHRRDYNQWEYILSLMWTDDESLADSPSTSIIVSLNV